MEIHVPNTQPRTEDVPLSAHSVSEEDAENVEGTRIFAGRGKAWAGGNINLDETRQRKGRIKAYVIVNRLRGGAEGAERGSGGGTQKVTNVLAVHRGCLQAEHRMRRVIHPSERQCASRPMKRAVAAYRKKRTKRDELNLTD